LAARFQTVFDSIAIISGVQQDIVNNRNADYCNSRTHELNLINFGSRTAKNRTRVLTRQWSIIVVTLSPVFRLQRLNSVILLGTLTDASQLEIKEIKIKKLGKTYNVYWLMPLNRTKITQVICLLASKLTNTPSRQNITFWLISLFGLTGNK